MGERAAWLGLSDTYTVLENGSLKNQTGII